MGVAGGSPGSADGDAASLSLCSLIAAMMGATFMKLGRAAAIRWTVMGDFVITAKPRGCETEPHRREVYR